MGYYHVRLDPDPRKLCTIVLPWGKFEYQRLPQGICNGPDVFQEKMFELFDGLVSFAYPFFSLFLVMLHVCVFGKSIHTGKRRDPRCYTEKVTGMTGKVTGIDRIGLTKKNISELTFCCFYQYTFQILV